MAKNKKNQVNTTSGGKCGHSGKWTGGGQSIFAISDGVIIITTQVCGECGDIKTHVEPLQIKKPEPELPIPAPKPVVKAPTVES